MMFVNMFVHCIRFKTGDKFHHYTLRNSKPTFKKIK